FATVRGVAAPHHVAADHHIRGIRAGGHAADADRAAVVPEAVLLHAHVRGGHVHDDRLTLAGGLREVPVEVIAPDDDPGAGLDVDPVLQVVVEHVVFDEEIIERGAGLGGATLGADALDRVARVVVDDVATHDHAGAAGLDEHA